MLVSLGGIFPSCVSFAILFSCDVTMTTPLLYMYVVCHGFQILTDLCTPLRCSGDWEGCTDFLSFVIAGASGDLAKKKVSY